MKNKSTKIIGILALLLGLGSLFVESSFSQETNTKAKGEAVAAIANDSTLEAPANRATGGNDLPVDRLIMVFAFICGLLYLTYWGLKKYTNWNKSTANKKRSLSVVDTIPLGGKKFVSVTRVYDRILILGVTENNINILSEIRDAEEGSAAVHEISPEQLKAKQNDKENFLNLISNITKKHKKSTLKDMQVAAGDKGSNLL